MQHPLERLCYVMISKLEAKKYYDIVLFPSIHVAVSSDDVMFFIHLPPLLIAFNQLLSRRFSQVAGDNEAFAIRSDHIGCGSAGELLPTEIPPAHDSLGPLNI